MRQFVESMKRLYEKQMVKKEKIDELLDSGKINLEEKKYILG